MWLLIIGLALFLGVHSINLIAPTWRLHQIEKIGLTPWKAVYALLSLVGFVLIVMGYQAARLSSGYIWFAPGWTQHITALLMLVAFVFLVATYIKDSKIKARVGHPMLLATKTWAIAHLISNGSVADVLLFTPILGWAVAAFILHRRRDRHANRLRTGSWKRDGFTAAIALVAYIIFTLYLHKILIGVQPFAST